LAHVVQHNQRVAAFIQNSDVDVDQRRRAVEPRGSGDDVNHIFHTHAARDAFGAQGVAHAAAGGNIKHVRYLLLHVFF